MKKLSLFAIIMIMVMAACNKQQDEFKESGDSTYADTKTLVVQPFTANGEFSSKLSSNGCQGLLTMKNRGHGGSFTIGDFGLSGQQCWGSCDSEDPLLARISNGEFTLIDSSGDQIFITYSDGCYEIGLDCSSPNGEYGCQVFTGYYAVTGGTGRYNDVGGEGTLIITQYLNVPASIKSEEPVDPVTSVDGLSEFVMDGSLTYPWIVEGNQNEF